MHMRLNLASPDLFRADSELHKNLITVMESALSRRERKVGPASIGRQNAHLPPASSTDRSLPEEAMEMYKAALLESFALDRTKKSADLLSKLKVELGITAETINSQRTKARTYLGLSDDDEDTFQPSETSTRGTTADCKSSGGTDPVADLELSEVCGANSENAARSVSFVLDEKGPGKA